MHTYKSCGDTPGYIKEVNGGASIRFICMNSIRSERVVYLYGT